MPSDEEVLARVQALQEAAAERQQASEVVLESNFNGYKFIRPLSEAATSALETIENNDERFKIGLHAIDLRTRGFGPKELVLITGFAHSGKTQLVNTAILNNRAKRVLFFSMDDPAEMILLKLVCMLHNVSADELERSIRNGDEKAKMWVRKASTEVFPNLIVIDESLSLSQMEVAINEATDLWGAAPQCVVIDFLASMAGESNDEENGVRAKAAALKRWVKDKPFPTVVVHQNSRSNGSPGEPITLLSGGYGGEAEATFVLGVRRKRDLGSLKEWERDNYMDSITIHLVKNKRPPGKKTPFDGIDFHMDERTGRIVEEREDLTSTDQALAVSEENRRER